MKGWILRIILCLILGAITTVAVAWGCSWIWLDEAEYREIEGPKTIDVPDRYVAWCRQKGYASVPIRAWVAWEVLAPGVRETTCFITWRRPDGSTRSEHPAAMHSVPSLLRIDAGWPWPCVSCERYFDSSLRMPNWVAVNGFEIGGLKQATPTSPRFSFTPPRFLPCRVLVGGMLADVTVFGSIWFAIFFGFASAKRFIRARRGRCPRCGYDLRGDRLDDGQVSIGDSPSRDARASGCPECGWNRTESEPRA